IVQEAIRSGYRLIDSATVYKNEEALGQILKEIFEDESFDVTRQDVFITSKLSPQHQGYEKCYQAVQDSLKRFGLDYFDLYLIHWPGTSKTKLSDPINQENRDESYRALEQLYNESKIKHIGVSNYTTRHLRHLLDTCTVKPHLHQFELHPCLYQPDILELCQANQIQVQAYSSLGEGKLINGEVDLVEIKHIAEKHNVSKALVLLRWAIQHDNIIIPKSKSPARVSENAKVFDFEISIEDMESLDQIHKAKPFRFCWDPTEVY
ncbi:Aldo/keto reductase, partial [Backusella circina FSU 941]